MKPLLAVIAILSVTASQLLATPAERKAIINNYGNSVVYIEVTMEASYAMEGSSDKSEQVEDATGIVVDQSGLIMVPLVVISPNEALKQVMEGMGDGSAESKKALDSFRIEIKKIVVKLPDGTELPATVVLKDVQSELAFIKTSAALPADIKAMSIPASVSVDLGDDLLCISRLGSVSKYAPRVSGMYIAAKLTDPKLRYVLESNFNIAGIPAFTTDGQWAGVVLPKLGSRFDKGYMQLIPISEVGPLLKKAQAAPAK